MCQEPEYFLIDEAISEASAFEVNFVCLFVWMKNVQQKSQDPSFPNTRICTGLFCWLAMAAAPPLGSRAQGGPLKGSGGLGP